MELDKLDVSSETQNLSPSDFARLGNFKKELEDIWKKEETALWQRSRDHRITDGDKNNAYFHAMANHSIEKTIYLSWLGKMV